MCLCPSSCFAHCRCVVCVCVPAPVLHTVGLSYVSVAQLLFCTLWVCLMCLCPSSCFAHCGCVVCVCGPAPVLHTVGWSYVSVAQLLFCTLWVCLMCLCPYIYISSSACPVSCIHSFFCCPASTHPHSLRHSCNGVKRNHLYSVQIVTAVRIYK